MKKNAYDAGREDGLYLALKIVREGGLEALEKENPVSEYHRDQNILCHEGDRRSHAGDQEQRH